MIPEFKRNPPKKRNYPERLEQKKVIPFLEEQLSYGHVIEFTATAQATFTGWAQININKMMGVRRGLPDLIILLSPKKGETTCRLLFIEMKHPGVAGQQSAIKDEQKVWIHHLNNIHTNVIAVVCWSGEEAIKIISELIGDTSCPTSEHPVDDFQNFLNEPQ